VSLRGLTIAEVFDRAAAGERRALGRLLTWVERGGVEADEVTELAHPASGGAHVVGITGAPGAGKSTLTGQLTRLLPELGVRPAVLAVDPSSPLTGGAILGDRIRMDDIAGEAAFIRSMATRGHSGGLALAVPGAVRVFDAAGYDPVIIETVGVGQVEVDVAGAADTTVVVVTPGWGDAVQANKAGLLEVADVFVVNKADRPGAKDARRDLELMLDLSHMTGQEDESGYRPPIVMASAIDGTGAPEVWDAIAAHRAHLESTGGLEARRAGRLRMEVANRVDQLLAVESETALGNEFGQKLLEQAAERSLSPAEAARRLTDRILSRP
jgi:LAO/AO transport system kinase